MGIKTFTVNLDGNLESGARSAAAAVTNLVSHMTLLEAAALGLGAATVALGIALTGMVGYAIEASERVDRLSASFGALSGDGPDAGRKVLASVRAIAAELPQAERVTESWAQQLMSVGVTDLGQLRAQLYAVSGAEALVEGGGERVRSLLLRLNEASERGTKMRFNVMQLAGTGVTEAELLKELGLSPEQLEVAKKTATLTGGQIATALTNAINAKAHGPLERAMHDITTRFAKGRDVIGHLFEGLNFDKVGEQLTDFFSIFDQSNASGQALKIGIGGAVSWLGDKFAWLLKQGTYAFLELILWSLKTYNFFRHNFALIGKFFDEHKGSVRTWATVLISAAAGVAGAYILSLVPALIASSVAFVSAIPSIAAYTVMMGALALSTLAAAGPWILLAAGIGLVVAALLYFWPQIKKAISVVEEWAEKGLDAARNFVAGLVGGIVGGVSSVVDAVKGLGKSAWDALSGFWKVHSPSQLAFGLGANIAEGQAQGLESKDARVSRASTDTLGARVSQAPADTTAVLPAARGGRASAPGGGVVANVDAPITIIAHDGQQARDVVDELEERLPSIYERWALSQGVAPA